MSNHVEGLTSDFGFLISGFGPAQLTKRISDFGSLNPTSYFLLMIFKSYFLLPTSYFLLLTSVPELSVGELLSNHVEGLTSDFGFFKSYFLLPTSDF